MITSEHARDEGKIITEEVCRTIKWTIYTNCTYMTHRQCSTSCQKIMGDTKVVGIITLQYASGIYWSWTGSENGLHCTIPLQQKIRGRESTVSTTPYTAGHFEIRTLPRVIFYTPIQTGPIESVARLFLRGKAAGEWQWPPTHNLVPRLKNAYSYISKPLVPSLHVI
jgi:hypothetical protein